MDKAHYKSIASEILKVVFSNPHLSRARGAIISSPLREISAWVRVIEHYTSLTT